MFDDDNKMRVYFSIQNYEHTHTYSGVLDDDTTWDELLSKIVATMEASYGYTFDMPDNYGIYYKGKPE